MTITRRVFVGGVAAVGVVAVAPIIAVAERVRAFEREGWRPYRNFPVTGYRYRMPGGAIWLHEGKWRWHVEEHQKYLGEESSPEEAARRVESYFECAPMIRGRTTVGGQLDDAAFFPRDASRDVVRKAVHEKLFPSRVQFGMHPPLFAPPNDEKVKRALENAVRAMPGVRDAVVSHIDWKTGFADVLVEWSEPLAAIHLTFHVDAAKEV